MLRHWIAAALLAIPACAQLKITTSDIPNATAGSAYTTSFAASGGTAPYTWAVTSGTLPTGISLASNGTLSGTTSVTGWTNLFTVRATDNVAATANLSYSFIVVPAVDAFGGLTSTSCAVTGFFHNIKIANRWWYCTPTGHLFMMFGLAAISPDACTGTGACVDPTTGVTDNYATIATAHYGDISTNWGCAQILRMKTWGFNVIGQQSSGSTDPVSSSCGTKLPAVSQVQMIYAANNLNGDWGTNGAVKDIVSGLPPVYTAYRGAAIMDVFDPNLPIGFHTLMNSLGLPTTWNSPYIVGTLGDDIDWLYALAAGPDFPTVPPGNTSASLAYLATITAPEQTFNANARGTKQLYANRQLYVKAAALDPGTCSIAAPCSYRDYMKKKYTTIGALNTAWGSSYTTFDSSATRATETVGTGDGVTKTFSFTLAHSPLSPMSIYVLQAGSIVGGDCPWWNCGGSVNTGILQSADNTLVSGSDCWVSAPSFDSPGAPYPAATYFTGCVYEYNDGSYGVRGPFQSISASAGQRPIWGAPVGGPADITGWKAYGDCIVASGAAAFGCHAAGTPGSALVFKLQASGLTLGVNWPLPNTGLANGAAEPTLPGAINYSTGVGTVTFTTAPTMGQTVQIAYSYSGWKSGGTGLMDEDGSGTWVGTNFYCLEPSRAVTGVCQGSTSPHDFPVADANVTFGADADAWMAQYSGKAHSIIRNEISTTNPLAAFLSFDTLGAWGVPPRKEILQGAAPYSDGAYPAWAPPGQDVSGCCAQLTYDYFDTYFGKPMFTAVFDAATADSFIYPFYGNPASDKGTQELKGAFYEATANSLLTLLSAGGNYNWVGLVGWGLLDFWTDGGGSTTRTNWGLVSLNDNPYDGKSACSVTRSDPLGFTSTAEANIPVWQATHAYAVDSGNGVYATVQPTSGTRYLFRQLTGSGTSGGSEPTWNTATGSTTTDGSVTWTNLGPKTSAVCFGDSVDYIKQGNALWLGLAPGGSGGTTSGGKITISGSVTLQ